MKSGATFVAILVTSAIVAGANWAVGRASTNSVPRQIMRSINAAGPLIDVLGAGNSLMAAGFDEAVINDVFQKAGRSAVTVNGALGSSTLIEQLALTRLALQRHTVRNLVYGFFDQQMATEPPLSNSDLIGNHAMLYYQEPQLTLRYARFSWLDRIEFQTYRCCALLQERGTIWAKVEKMRRAMEQVGMPSQENNRFGRRADFNLLESGTAEQFANRCREVLRSGDFLSPAIQELFREARAHGSRITVVEMPMHPLHVQRFYDQPAWDEFRIRNRAAVDREGGVYINASRWIPQESDFQDHLHLATSGAARFSRMLAEQILTRDASAARSAGLALK